MNRIKFFLLAGAVVLLMPVFPQGKAWSFQQCLDKALKPSLQILQPNNEIYAKALLVQPQITSASLKTSTSQLALKVSKGARYPRLNFGASKEQVAAAELSYKAAEQKFNVGLMAATDFLIKKNNFYQAQSSLIQAKFDYIFKNKILDFYQGKPITF